MMNTKMPEFFARMSGFAAICAAVLMPSLGGRAVAETASPVVTTTADVVADDGLRSLREAMDYANANPGTTIRFNLPLAQAVGGVFTIRPTSALPQITAGGTVIDGTTQTAATGDTNVAGPEIELDGSNAGSTPQVGQVSGLFIMNAPNCVVRNIVINSFSGRGLRLFGSLTSGTRVAGCYIGTNAAGTTAKPNSSNGLALHAGAKNSIIGGTTIAARNVIAGNAGSSIVLTDSGTDNNLVQGNTIGTNAAGTARLGNNVGVHIANGPKNNIIGGTSPGTGNVIVGGGTNLQIQGAGTSGNTVQGNYIGTEKTGMTAIDATGHSILITANADHNTIGGTTVAARNVISNGDASAGALGITFSNYNTVQGNYIGINAAGTGVLGTGNFGLLLYASSYNTVGGTGNGAGNAIAGNNRIGVWLFAEPDVPRTTYNTVQGNTIGTNPSGTAALGSQTIGLEINGGCDNNVIGLAWPGPAAAKATSSLTVPPAAQHVTAACFSSMAPISGRPAIRCEATRFTATPGWASTSGWLVKSPIPSLLTTSWTPIPAPTASRISRFSPVPSPVHPVHPRLCEGHSTAILTPILSSIFTATRSPIPPAMARARLTWARPLSARAMTAISLSPSPSPAISLASSSPLQPPRSVVIPANLARTAR